MFMWELSTETNGIETVVVRLQLASIFATVFFKGIYCLLKDAKWARRADLLLGWRFQFLCFFSSDLV